MQLKKQKTIEKITQKSKQQVVKVKENKIKGE